VAGLADISPETLTAPGRQDPSSENTATSTPSSPDNLSEDAHALRQRCPQQVAPDVPRRAIRAGITAGRVELRLHIAQDGAIRQAEILRAEPEGVFDTAALAAAMQWHCLPAADAGSSARVSFVFKQD
jgi:protein TonB